MARPHAPDHRAAMTLLSAAAQSISIQRAVVRHPVAGGTQSLPWPTVAGEARSPPALFNERASQHEHFIMRALCRTVLSRYADVGPDRLAVSGRSLGKAGDRTAGLRECRL